MARPAQVKIAEQDEILRKNLHISYIDQFVEPPIFNGLNGAKMWMSMNRSRAIRGCRAIRGRRAIRGCRAIHRRPGPSMDNLDPPLAPNTSEASSNKRYNWICLALASRFHMLAITTMVPAVLNLELA